MAQGDTPITLIGNVVADPELRYTSAGAAVANFRVASTPRVFNKDSNQWEEADALFLTCNIWREAAENVMETLSKGMRVIVQGRLRQRSYETREGERRTVYEIEVDEVGPSLKWATAQVTRNPKGNGGGGRSAQAGDSWNRGGQPAAQSGGATSEDPWNNAGGGQGGAGGGDSEPPF